MTPSTSDVESQPRTGGQRGEGGASVPLHPLDKNPQGEGQYAHAHVHCAECTKIMLKRERMQHVQRLCFTFWGVVALFVFCAMIFGIAVVKAGHRRK